MKSKYLTLRISFIRILFQFLVVIGSVTLTTAQSVHLPPCPPQTYDHHEWLKRIDPSACWEDVGTPTSTVYNTTFLRGDLPNFGYPLHHDLFRGINDTIQAEIVWENSSGQTYIMKGKDYEHWFVPKVFTLSANSPGGPPFVDSAQLSYRIRGWYNGIRKIPAQDTVAFPAVNTGIIMDIWNLPIGKFQLCIEPTTKVPGDFTAITNGCVYEYYPPHSLADSINGYEACMRRAWYDGDSNAIAKWIETILTVNSKSVPGWWLKASFEWELRDDKAAAKAAYNKALAYLDARTDPALPNEAVRPLQESEKHYLSAIREIMSYNLKRLGP